MKTYQQMAQAVFSARDAYLRKKQRQKVLFFRYAPVAASFGFAVVMGLHPWQNRQNFPAVSSPEETAVQSEMETETKSTTTAPESVPVIITETRTSETVPEIPSETLPEISTTAVQTSAETQTSVIIQTTTQTVQTIPDVPEPVTEAPELPELPETVLIIEQPEIIPETLPVTESVPETMPIPTESETLPYIDEQPQAETTVPDGLTEQGASIAFAFPRITLHLAKNSLGNDSGEDAVFCLTGNTVSPELVGEWFDTVDVTVRYADGSQKLVENIGNAYLIEGMPYGTAAAVQFEGEENYYLFRSADISEEEFRNLFFDSENQNQ